MSNPQETPPTDYSQYSHSDLLRRVTDLESQLRHLNNTTQVRPTTPPEPKKKPKRAPKPFDPSRYHTRLIALKFAYLGGNYNGFEHHANNATSLPTVEEVLWRVLRKTKLIFPDFQQKDHNEVCWDGCEYSKCGRTDRGVSAFGQVVGIRVRSSRPNVNAVTNGINDADSSMPEAGAGAYAEELSASHDQSALQPAWDSVRDELPYIHLLNRVLPPDIRILAWCPDPPPDFSARFNCKERRYRYFFTNPAYATASSSGEAWLDVEKMRIAAKKLEGLHDFRNLCKVDPNKQLTNFERRIFHAGIHSVNKVASPATDCKATTLSPELYCFEVRGSAFLWHQVRHMVAILFLVGQGYEEPKIVDHLVDIEACPNKPVYEMADDRPLVLWDCIFPDSVQLSAQDHEAASGNGKVVGYRDTLNWIYAGDEAGGCDPSKRAVPGIDDGKYGRYGIMDDLWALWRKSKIDGVLAGSLMDVVAQTGSQTSAQSHVGNEVLNGVKGEPERSDRVFDGSVRPRTVGRYVPLMQRERLDAPDVVNARYAARKGLTPHRNGIASDTDVEE